MASNGFLNKTFSIHRLRYLYAQVGRADISGCSNKTNLDLLIGLVINERCNIAVLASLPCIIAT